MAKQKYTKKVNWEHKSTEVTVVGYTVIGHDLSLPYDECMAVLIDYKKIQDLVIIPNLLTERAKEGRHFRIPKESGVFVDGSQKEEEVLKLFDCGYGVYEVK